MSGLSSISSSYRERDRAMKLCTLSRKPVHGNTFSSNYLPFQIVHLVRVGISKRYRTMIDAVTGNMNQASSRNVERIKLSRIRRLYFSGRLVQYFNKDHFVFFLLPVGACEVSAEYLTCDSVCSYFHRPYPRCIAE